MKKTFAYFLTITIVVLFLILFSLPIWFIFNLFFVNVQYHHIFTVMLFCTIFCVWLSYCKRKKLNEKKMVFYFNQILALLLIISLALYIYYTF